MTARILNGKQLAAEIRREIAADVAEFLRRSTPKPCLAAVLVGEDPASQVYVRNKQRACDQVGMDSQLHKLPEQTSEEELVALVSKLNRAEAVSGILIQLPLPRQICVERVLDGVDPRKDVDCLHPENLGRLMQGRARFLPCTPHGVQQILHRSGIKTAGCHAVVVGRSEIVGKPLAALLMQRDSRLGPDYANATVTVCHSRTTNLPQVTQQADILIAALGSPAFITAEMIKPGATVVDVGINRTSTGLVGDVAFEAALEVAGAITPVPGGVGPLTIAMLLRNTLDAARERQRQ